MNNIKVLPKYLEGLPLLQDLCLHQNRIVNLPSTIFCGMSSLTCLDIGKNRLNDCLMVGKSLSNAPTLRKVVLSQNRLNGLPRPLTLPLMKELWLSENEIKSTQNWTIKTSVWLPCLRELHLHDNCISTLYRKSVGLVAPCLQLINLGFNNLSCLRNLIKECIYFSCMKR